MQQSDARSCRFQIFFEILSKLAFGKLPIESCSITVILRNFIFNAKITDFFKPREQQWFEFVINNRMDEDFLLRNNITNHNKDNKFDIVFGEIADGTISSVANSIKNGDININDVDYSLFIPESGRYYENQYSFHSLKALSCAIIKPHYKGKRRRR